MRMRRIRRCQPAQQRVRDRVPPRSGQDAGLPEVDAPAWFTLEEARGKINVSQRPFNRSAGASRKRQRSRFRLLSCCVRPICINGAAAQARLRDFPPAEGHWIHRNGKVRLDTRHDLDRNSKALKRCDLLDGHRASAIGSPDRSAHAFPSPTRAAMSLLSVASARRGRALLPAPSSRTSSGSVRQRGSRRRLAGREIAFKVRSSASRAAPTMVTRRWRRGRVTRRSTSAISASLHPPPVYPERPCRRSAPEGAARGTGFQARVHAVADRVGAHVAHRLSAGGSRASIRRRIACAKIGARAIR